ncbi:MAG: hypothetical protein JF596_17125, partial [Stenotrophomonas sp.]|nr:hypothetical protein [Stenotrophomonas sp.]
MANSFDQFDTQPAKQPAQQPEANPFDQFGAAPAQTAAPKPAATSPGFFGSVARGFKRSLPETKSLLYGAGAAVAGAVGADDLRDSALENYQRIQRDEIDPLQGQASFKGVLSGEDSAADWAGDVLGNFGGQAVQSLATGAAGAAVGSAAPGAGTAAGAVGGIVARGAVRKLVTEAAEKLIAEQVERGVAREVAEAAGKAALQRNLQKIGGAAIANVGFNTAQEAGISYTGRADDAAAAGESLDQGDAVRALGAGVVAGSLDSLAEGVGVGRLL